MSKLAIFLLSSLFIFFLFPSSCQAKVWINEFVANPVGDEEEWVELYNDGPDQDLTNWSLEDKDGNSHSLSQLGTIKQNQFKVFYYYRDYWLNNSGDSVILKNNQDEEDSYTYGNAKENESIGRSPDGSDNWMVFNQDQISQGSSNYVVSTIAPTKTLDPTNTPTETETPTPEPTKEPEDNNPKITVTNINNLSDIKVGVKFYPDYTLENFKPKTKYRLKVRIGQETNKMDLGLTRSENLEWLHDKRSWDLFPEIETDKDGKKSGGLRAKIKENSPEGDYYLKIRAYEVDSEKTFDSQEYKITAGSQPTPTATPEPTTALTNTAQDTPTPTQNPTSTSNQTPTPTPDGSPTPTSESTPTPEDGKPAVLGDKVDKGEDNQRGQYLGEATKAKIPPDKKKLIAGGTIGFGGLLIVGAGLSPQMKNIFDKMKHG